ncbi:glycosyltransferase family 92 protein RCOM_0530710 [Cornus florida]|uniref:glycosyltransferase family 92 protein RCOM_0530710 n=1 Tax=Cornus florida TaxID=4283 RepID=UPI002899448B|nr:glycosyltransferase family 92 protein RCOM_0530710 [Cornus florida]
MDSEQRRKRKRRALYSARHYFSVRSLILCLGFVSFLYFLSDRIPIISSSAFKPVLVVSSLSLRSSSSNSIQDYHDSDGSSSSSMSSSSNYRVDDGVMFPDHVLLMVSNRNGLINNKSQELECVYCETATSISFNNNYTGSDSSGVVDNDEIVRDVLSVDEYDGLRSIVRCPLPPANYSGAISLRWRKGDLVDLDGGGRGGGDGRLRSSNQRVYSWENLVYAASLDRDSVVVFVKGLNLRPDRASDAAQFSCHFGLGNWERDGRLVLTTEAITAAQEVVRCLLPRSIQKNPSKARGIRVTIGVTPHVHAGAHDHVLVPSVARISSFKSEGEEKKSKGGKYELCVCTMVWNQASSLREWITYHAWLGVERWFIYDNNSDDNIKEVIEELELEDYNVTRHVWPWIKTQEAGFSHCALRARDECNWVGFMDVDEFFYFPFPTPRRQKFKKLGFPGQNSLRSLVENFSSSTIAEIRTACHSFGPSGLSSPPPQGVTVGYTCRLQSPERHKSIVRPEALDVTLLNVVHHFHLRKGFKYLNLPQGTAVLNHYKYQVWEAFRAKFFRRVATYVADWQENQNEGSRDRAPGLGTEAIEPPNWHLQFCEVWDTGLRDFVLANLADPGTGLLPWERSFLQ